MKKTIYDEEDIRVAIMGIESINNATRIIAKTADDHDIKDKDLFYACAFIALGVRNEYNDSPKKAMALLYRALDFMIVSNHWNNQKGIKTYIKKRKLKVVTERNREDL